MEVYLVDEDALGSGVGGAECVDGCLELFTRSVPISTLTSRKTTNRGKFPPLSRRPDDLTIRRRGSGPSGAPYVL